MTAPISPDEVLVLANRNGVCGLNIADGSLLWEHPLSDHASYFGAPLVERVDDDVVVVCESSTLTFLRLVDGTIVGRDVVWFVVHCVVRHGAALVVQGNFGAACYRKGVRTWGLTGMKRDPSALVFTEMMAWTADATGAPRGPVGQMRADLPTTLLLGSSVTPVDRTAQHRL